MHEWNEYKIRALVTLHSFEVWWQSGVEATPLGIENRCAENG